MSLRTPILVLILGALAGAIGVLSIQSALSSGPNHDSAAAEPSARSTDPELAAALRDVATELRALREERERSSQQVASSQRIEATDSGTAAPPDLAAAMRALAEALRAREAGTAPSQAGPTLVVPPADAPHARFSAPPAGNVDENRRRITREHLFWTEQQILDRYGSPTEIYPGDQGAISWLYEVENRKRFIVTFHSGRVIVVLPPN